MRRKCHLIGLLLFLVVTACGAAPTPVPTTFSLSGASDVIDAATGLILPAGYTVQVVSRGFNQPTSLAYGPDGLLYVTQLNGGENDGKGQVVRRVGPGKSPEVMLDGLTKPTGLAWIGQSLYIVARDTVLVSHWHDGKLDPPTVWFKDLPFNGRSNGGIFVGPDGFLYFESTGNANLPRDSGFIYRVDPASNDLKIYARGLKNGYAMAWNPATGQMYSTEIGDGYIQDVGQPPEELNIIHPSGNYGWPFCYGNQESNTGWGGNRNICADTDPPLAMFPPQSTPTGLAFYDGKLIVALWNGTPPRLVSVDPNSGAISEFASGFQQPIALLSDPNGSLLIVDMGAGIIYRLIKTQ